MITTTETTISYLWKSRPDSIQELYKHYEYLLLDMIKAESEYVDIAYIVLMNCIKNFNPKNTNFVGYYKSRLGYRIIDEQRSMSRIKKHTYNEIRDNEKEAESIYKKTGIKTLVDRQHLVPLNYPITSKEKEPYEKILDLSGYSDIEQQLIHCLLYGYSICEACKIVGIKYRHYNYKIQKGLITKLLKDRYGCI